MEGRGNSEEPSGMWAVLSWPTPTTRGNEVEELNDPHVEKDTREYDTQALGFGDQNSITTSVLKVPRVYFYLYKSFPTSQTLSPYIGFPWTSFSMDAPFLEVLNGPSDHELGGKAV